MRRVLSTYLFVEHRLTVALLDRILRSGVDEIEIFCARQHLDYHNHAQIEELKHWFRDAELKVHSIHSPLFSDDIWGRSGPHALISMTGTTKAQRIAATDEVKRAIELADSVPFQYAIQHIGVPEEEYDDRKVEAAFNCLDELIVFGKQLGVEVLVENIPNAFSRAERLKLFVGTTHLPLNFCFDTGHAHLSGGVESEFRLMKDRIRSTHVHDNDGELDNHIFPLSGGGGSIEWGPAMELLDSCDDDVPLVLELREVPEMENPLAEVQNCFEKLESALDGR
jgi:sugar phosphate isomerase/epimerase